MTRAAKTRAALWVGLLVGCGFIAAILQLPFVNWYPVVPPVDARPLTVRKDAGGDGRFFAPRSGHRHHRGLDLVAELDSPVRAIRSGAVATVALHHGLGRYVEIDHRQGLRSVYAHLNRVDVAVGQRVSQGAIIGTVGKTGNARRAWITPHLHLEILRDGQPVDPQTLGLQVAGPPVPGVLASPEPLMDDSGEE